MSAIISELAADIIDINSEWGRQTRTFSKYPAVYETDSTNPYNSAMFLVYTTTKLIPNWMPDYTNHFAMYKSDHHLIIDRTETSLQQEGIDAEQMIHSITPTKCSKLQVNDNWMISRDDISFSENLNLENCKPVCVGEWWYYDKGYILNGLGNYQSWFIYYELHAPNIVKSTKKTNALNSVGVLGINSPIFDTPQPVDGKPSSDLELNLQLKDNFSFETSLKGKIASKKELLNKPINPPSSINLVSNIKPIVSNFNKQPTNPSRFQNIIPSKFWFENTGKELEKGDIENFKSIDGFLPSLETNNNFLKKFDLFSFGNL